MPQKVWTDLRMEQNKFRLNSKLSVHPRTLALGWPAVPSEGIGSWSKSPLGLTDTASTSGSKAMASAPLATIPRPEFFSNANSWSAQLMCSTLYGVSFGDVLKPAVGPECRCTCRPTSPLQGNISKIAELYQWASKVSAKCWTPPLQSYIAYTKHLKHHLTRTQFAHLIWIS